MRSLQSLIGKFISLKQKWNIIRWVLIKIEKDQVILLSSPGDYLIDGCIIIPLHTIKAYRYDRDEKFTEKVLIANNKIPEKIIINDKESIYETLKDKNTYIWVLKADKLYVWKFIKYNVKKIRIKEIDSKAEDWKKKVITIKKITSIIFDDDYIISLVKYKENKSKK